MKALLLCLMLAALPVFGGHQENSLAPMGLRFTWRSVSAAYSSVVWVELAVITFKGRCDVAGLSPHSSNPGPLGWTHVSKGVILPFAEVNCQGIRGFIQKDLLTMPAEDREEAYDRALGRVLAHELYHIFANTAAHSPCGVGKSKYTVQELLCPEFRFEDRESPALRSSKAHAALEWAALGR
jgi:hypothetical protein